MSSSRLRDEAPTIFDVFCEISRDRDDAPAKIQWKYPDDFNEKSILKSIVEFSFPTSVTPGDAVQLFTFVLTNDQARYSFGYCRHTPGKNACFCVLSALPWTDVFYRLLNHVAALAKRSPGRLTDEAESMLVRAYHQEIPGPGERLVLDSGLGSGNKVEFVCPNDAILPRIPDNRNLTEYYNAVGEEHMLAVFANLVCERRIVFTSSKLGKLSACIIASSGLLYPMHWQHIFIPVLPDHLVNILQAPMPFLIGVPSVTFGKLQRERIDLSEVVILHLDSQQYVSPFDDFADLPNEIVHVLKKNLRSSNHLLGDGVARSFLRALVVLLEGYREALRFRQGEAITFSEEAFIQSRPMSMRKFLEKMLHFQIFRQFVEERLSTLNSQREHREFNEFEEECNLYSAKEYNRFKAQYNEWIGNMKKEGGALFKNLSKKGREAIVDFRSIISDLKESPMAGRASSPAILRRFNSTVNGTSKQSPSRRAALSKSAVLREEMDSLKGADEEEEQRDVRVLGIGGTDLLGELQDLLRRPDSFIEKMEKQHQDFQRLQKSAVQEQQEPLVSFTIDDPVSPSPLPDSAQEAPLIDFVSDHRDGDDFDIQDFDPLACKSASAPVSPNKQRSKASTTRSNDLGTAAAPMSAITHRWETFE